MPIFRFIHNLIIVSFLSHIFLILKILPPFLVKVTLSLYIYSHRRTIKYFTTILANNRTEIKPDGNYAVSGILVIGPAPTLYSQFVRNFSIFQLLKASLISQSNFTKICNQIFFKGCHCLFIWVTKTFRKTLSP